jgi:hypothetical protein
MDARRFVSIQRSIGINYTHTIDAIDQDGRAWWLVLGDSSVPETWTELQPLPSRDDRP